MEPLGSRSSAHRIVLQALGVPARAPTLLLTGNLANQKVSQNAQSATRSRYFLIRSACLHQRIADGEVCVVHVPDPENPSDYLTKFIGAEKTASSIAYSIGKQRRFARADVDEDDVVREVREVPCDAAMAGCVCHQPGV